MNHDKQSAAFAPEAWENAARLLYRALDRIYIEELNGRICPMPDGLPDLNDQIPEYRGCENCRRHWTLAIEAIRAYEELVPRVRAY